MAKIKFTKDDVNKAFEDALNPQSKSTQANPREVLQKIKARGDGNKGVTFSRQ